MICIVKDGSIIYGPAKWTPGSVKAVLLPLGWSLAGGEFFSPDGIATPEGGGNAPQDMGNGAHVLPVVEVGDPAPEGKEQGGTSLKVLPDCVELRPLWVDLPLPPRTMTKYAFRTRVLTFVERMTLDNSTIPELVTMRNDLAVAEVVDLDEVAKYRPVMLGTGLATEARIDEIIAGVTHG